MKRGYKYRIYPTEEQKKYFDVCFAACRWYWNYALNKINEQYAKDKTHLTSYNISRDLPQLKKKEETKWLSTVDSYSLTYTGICLDKAFNKFFNKNGGFPKHSQFRYDGSYTIQVKLNRQNVVDWSKSLVRVGKAGWIKVIFHRKFEGVIKTMTISKKSFDYYEISFLVDDNFVKPEEKKTPTFERTIGIDLGAKTKGDRSNAILSDGTKFQTINVEQELKQLKRLQRRLSKKEWKKTGEKKFSKKFNKEVEVKKPSKNYIKLKNRIAKLEDKIARKRDYNTHQITSYVAKNKDYGTVCIENLNVKGMVRNHHLAKSVSNANMGEARRQFEYKCDWNGKNLVMVDRFYPSSQLCSKCGYKNEKVKNLSLIQWTCPICGEHHDRDINAAVNIRKEGYRILTEGKQ